MHPAKGDNSDGGGYQVWVAKVGRKGWSPGPGSQNHLIIIT